MNQNVVINTSKSSTADFLPTTQAKSKNQPKDIKSIKYLDCERGCSQEQGIAVLLLSMSINAFVKQGPRGDDE